MARRAQEKERGKREEGKKKEEEKKKKEEEEKEKERIRSWPPAGGGQALPGAKHAKGPVLRHKLSISVAKLKAPF